MADPRRAKVLHVTRNMPPLRGGMERLNQHLALELSRTCEVTVVGPEGCGEFLPLVAHVAEVASAPLWQFIPQALVRCVVEAFRQRPQLIIAGSGLTAPMAWIAARLTGARAMVYLHGLDVVVRSRVYRALWIPLIRRCDHVLVNSRNTGRLAEGAGVCQARISVLNPGFEPQAETPDAAREFRKKFDLGDRRLLLSVGRMTPRKGLLDFIERALPEIVSRVPDALLIVVGDDAPDALHAVGGSGIRRAMIEVAARLKLDRHLRLLGPCDDETLSGAYFAASAHVFPVLELPGDVEGFGMVALEAAGHGLPTVAFAVGGVPDAVAQGLSGHLVAADDYAGFAAAVIEVCSAADGGVSRLAARQFAEPFRWEAFGERLRLLAGVAEYNDKA